MTPLHRIIDASANRSREALRVLEDIARFALNDQDLSGDLKRLRHALTEAVGSLAASLPDALMLLESRDTEGDVFIVRRRLDRLDLIAVLKTRE